MPRPINNQKSNIRPSVMTRTRYRLRRLQNQTRPSAVKEVFGIPEILARIFYLMARPKGLDLLCAALVCRGWCPVALESLWKGFEVESPDIHHLHQMDTDGSLDKYIPLISCLNLQLRYSAGDMRARFSKLHRPFIPRVCCKSPESHMQWLEHGKFRNSSNLHTLILSSYVSYMDTATWHGVLSPNLKILKLEYAQFEKGFLDIVATQVPHLEAIHLTENWLKELNISDDEKREFYNRMPRLKSIINMGDDISVQTLQLLASRPGLKEVSLTTPTGCNVANAISKDSFCSLTFLELHHHQNPGPLLPLSTMLETLDLAFDLNPENVDFLSILHPLRRLRTLKLYINVPETLCTDIDSIIQVTNLTTLFNHTQALQVFALTYMKMTIGRIEISRQEYKHLMTSVPPTIREFQVPFSIDCGCEEVTMLFRLPELRQLGISGEFLMNELSDWKPPVVASKLRSVAWRVPDEFWADDIVKAVLHDFFPRLERWVRPCADLRAAYSAGHQT